MSRSSSSSNSKFHSISKKKDTRARKLAVLETIDKLKGALFCPCVTEEAQQVKEMAWGEVLEKARSLRLVSSRRGWKYIRDKQYNAWKARTMNKLSSVRSSGVEVDEAAGVKKKMSAVDFKILDIICTTLSLKCPGHPDQRCDAEKDTASNSSQTDDVWEGEKKIIYPIDNYTFKKQDLTLQLLEQDIYVRQLTALKLEKDIGLKNSTYQILKQMDTSS